MQSLSIGRLAGATGCSVPTIRYYEAIGLLPRARRAANGHRCYGERDIRQLRFIKQCRDFGFSIEQTRRLLTLIQDDGSTACTAALSVVQPHVDALRERINELKALERTLSQYIRRCHSECAESACEIITQWEK